tara:strand:- start:59 stop:781 length:723 start_codon:yes stop_codon:yes gene_type:complete
MKKLLYIFLATVFAFNCSNEPVNNLATSNTESEFKGLWSGSFAQEENGSWIVSVNEYGQLIGSLTSLENNIIYNLEGSVDTDGHFQAILIRDSAVGEFNGQLEESSSYGSYYNDVDDRGGDVIGRKSTETESSIIDYWFYYSELLGDDLTTYDNDRYCPELFMEFRNDGTFLDYWSLSSSGCEENQYSGTWSVQDGYYELVYTEGGSNALTASDIYIIFTDDNTMEYDYVNAVYTYKREL